MVVFILFDSIRLFNSYYQMFKEKSATNVKLRNTKNCFFRDSIQGNCDRSTFGSIIPLPWRKKKQFSPFTFVRFFPQHLIGSRSLLQVVPVTKTQSILSGIRCVIVYSPFHWAFNFLFLIRISTDLMLFLFDAFLRQYNGWSRTCLLKLISMIITVCVRYLKSKIRKISQTDRVLRIKSYH